tara:strand:+ start:6903 stop:7442 length:540 start_codon:yes stop_codon:yes gene_type:complete
MSTLTLGGSTLASKSGSVLSLDSGVTFPSGNIQQIQSVTCTSQQDFTSDTPTAVTGFNKAITVGKTGSKILVTLNLVGWGTSNTNSGNRCYTKITESVTSLDYWISDIDGWTNTSVNQFHTLTFYYLHTHGQNAGTALTYTPKFANGSGGSNGTKFNYYYAGAHGGNNRESYMLLTELA